MSLPSAQEVNSPVIRTRNTFRKLRNSSGRCSTSIVKETAQDGLSSFPSPLSILRTSFFRTEGHERFLNHICDIAGEKGNTYFVFDRGETAKISECCRLSFKLEKSDLEDAVRPWKMRYSAMQNVTLNLPRIAYEAKGDDTKLFSLLTERVSIAADAHVQKKTFIERLLSLGESGPAGSPEHGP